MQGIRVRFFEFIYRLVRYRAWWVLLFSLLLSTLALYYTIDLPIKESLLDLLPQNDPLIEQFKLRNEELQQSDSMAILLQWTQPPPSDSAARQPAHDELVAIAQTVVHQLQFYPQINSASYQLDPKIATFKRLLADPESLRQFQVPIEQLQATADDIAGLFGPRLELFYLSPQNDLSALSFAPAQGNAAGALGNTQWALKSLGYLDSPQIVPAQAEITLTITPNGALRGRAVCTNYSAVVTDPDSFFSPDNIDIRLAQFAATPLQLGGGQACQTPAELAALERDYLDALRGIEHIFIGSLSEKLQAISHQLVAFIQDQTSTVSTLSVSRLITILTSYNQQLVSALARFPGQLLDTQANVNALLLELRQLAAQFQTPEPDLSPDGRSLRILIQPAQPSYVSLNFNKQVVALVEDTLAQAINPQRVRAYIAGSYSFTTESNQALRQDMFYTTLISVVGIALIFLLTFRGVIYPLLVVIPLSMGAVWTAAWAKYALGGFNLVTALLPALLLGLGINYGIHLVGRFVEERQTGRSVSAALRLAILHKGDAMLSGAITTALVFFVMLLSKSRGLYEMGVVAGFGVLASVVLTLLVLPSLMVIAHLVLRHRLNGQAGYRWQLRGAVRFVLRARAWVIALVLLATLGLSGPASQVRVQFVSEDLMATGLPTQKAREVLRQAGFGANEGSGDFFLFFLADQAQAHQLEQTLQPLPLVLDISSVRNYFEQTSVLQNLNLAQLFSQSNRFIDDLVTNLSRNDELVAQLGNTENSLRFWRDQANLFGQNAFVELLNRLIEQLTQIQTQLGTLNVGALTANLFQLQALVEQVQQLTANTLLIPASIDEFLTALPEELRNQFITQGGEFIVYVQVSKDIYLEGNYERFISAVEPITRNYIGMPMIQHQLELAMEQDFWISTLGAFVLIFLSLLLDFSGAWMLRAALLVLLPLGLGYVWMLGGMGLLKLSFNLTNMVISPLLIGIGVDNGIHLIHRYLERPNDPQRVQHATESVAMPTLIANLATMAAFGSLMFASTPGLPVLGKSAVIGVGAVAFCSLTLLPAVLVRRR